MGREMSSNRVPHTYFLCDTVCVRIQYIIYLLASMKNYGKLHGDSLLNEDTAQSIPATIRKEAISVIWGLPYKKDPLWRHKDCTHSFWFLLMITTYFLYLKRHSFLYFFRTEKRALNGSSKTWEGRYMIPWFSFPLGYDELSDYIEDIACVHTAITFKVWRDCQ